jgi:fructose-1,6-bisphosphatase/inositol monophosphatase family enzyme
MNESPASIDAFHRAVEALLRDTAERVVMPRYRALAEHEIEEKAADDFVTVADREAEAMLEEGLARIIPGLACVGEEAAFADPLVLERLSSDCWIVDPIDGTANFAAGRPPFAIMLAMASGGEAHTGWIFDPIKDRLLIAHKGKGAFRNGEKVVARPSGRTRPNLAAMTKFMAPEQRALFEAEILPHYEPVKAPQCSAEQYPLTVWGEHDLAIYERTLAWDHAAGSLFLNEAGGRAARPDGTPYRVDDGRTGMVAATTPQLFDEFVERLERSGYKAGA